ncbi:MAG TPA: response regulator, partial [Trueperaceae bacterium]|nr:response regulator [Trueperaceae bacterium]
MIEQAVSAPKPIIYAVDDDLGVLGAVARDLRNRYGEVYRIMRATSGAAALAELGSLRLANGTVALFLVDQRMPNMSGLEFLAQARELYPDAKRVLLTAYADSRASIEAINTTRL